MTPQERFIELIKGLEIKQISSSNIIFGNRTINLFNYNLKSKYLWCSHKYVWSIFEKEYSLNYGDIQSLIKSMVENPLKLKEVTPLRMYQMEVENPLKLKEVTPFKELIGSASRVENPLKLEGVTPIIGPVQNVVTVENPLK